MGRRRKIEDFIRHTAEREKQKIKESVLEVFRTRSKSPGGNGAFLVAGPNNNTTGKNKRSPDKNSNLHGLGGKHLREVNVAADGERSDDNMSPVEHSSRSRKRKSNKTKEAKIKLHKTGEHADMAQSHSASNLKYALRSAQEHKDQHARNAISRIASNRMTKRLGLFNQGKKSETILRVYTSNGRQRTAEEDLRDFLGKGTSEADRINSPLSSQCRSGEEREPETGISVDHSGPERSFRSNHSTHSITHSITPASVHSLAAPHSIGSHASSCSSAVKEEHLPLIEEIVDQVLGRINPKTLFPDKVDYLRETTDELRRIMRTNAPRSCTPTPSLQPYSSVKRSLLTRYLTPSKGNKREERTNPKYVSSTSLNIETFPSKIEECKHSEVSTRVYHTEFAKSRSYALGRRPLSPEQRLFATHLHDLSDFQSDEQTLLQCHDQVIANANHQNFNQLTNEQKDLSLEQLCNADGLDILKIHDEQTNRLVNHGWKTERQGDNWMKDKENCWRKERTTDDRRKTEREDSWTRNREKENWKQVKEENGWKSLFSEMHEFSSQSSTGSSRYQGSQVLRETGNCKTETIPAYSGADQISEFMPQFHDQNYYTGNHSSGMSNRMQSLDILEILDEEKAPGSYHGYSRQDKYPSHSNRLSNPDILDNLNPEPSPPGMSLFDRSSQQERSLQKGASQGEYHFFLKKPSLDTPSPPDELFKKHNLIP
ncbi:uncharacterized protein LOC144625307 isoform X5 [Crassostrea virginica]